jgi:anaphase-promoting complex subunit 3
MSSDSSNVEWAETAVSDTLLERLRDIIYYSLDQQLYLDALFYAEKLVAYTPKDENSIHLLAQCHCRLQRIQAAMEILRGCVSPACRYLFAWCALELNQCLEAERALNAILAESETTRE